MPEWCGKLSKRFQGLVAVSLETAEDLLVFSDIGPAFFLRLAGMYLLAILIKVDTFNSIYYFLFIEDRSPQVACLVEFLGSAR